MIRCVSLATLLVFSAGCQQNRPPTTAASVSGQASQRSQQREPFLAELERRVASARRQPASATPEMVRDMEELLQTLRRSPNPELLLNAMLAGASPGPQVADASSAELHQQAVAAEQLGLRQDALALYRRSAEGGFAASVARLRELDPAVAATTPPTPPRNAQPVNLARLLAAVGASSLLTAGGGAATTSPEEAYSRAAGLEQESKLDRALALYLDSSQRGHGPASQRLMEIFASGAPGLTRDYVVAVKYKELALRQGSQIETLPRR